MRRTRSSKRKNTIEKCNILIDVPWFNQQLGTFSCAYDVRLVLGFRLEQIYETCHDQQGTGNGGEYVLMILQSALQST